MFGSWIIQTLMALLVALPPGTFRALDALSRSLYGNGVVAASSSAKPGRFASPPVGTAAPCGCEVARPAPHGSAPPFQGRTWADRTFITKNAPELDAVCWNASPPSALAVEAARPLIATDATRAIDSPRHAHCSPRRVLIAVGALLL